MLRESPWLVAGCSQWFNQPSVVTLGIELRVLNHKVVVDELVLMLGRFHRDPCVRVLVVNGREVTSVNNDEMLGDLDHIHLARKQELEEVL